MKNVKIESTIEWMLNLIDEYVKDERNLTFLVKGDLASILCNYVESEWDLEQWIEDKEDYLEVFDPDKLYWLDLTHSDINGEFDYIYYVQEAIYKGLLLQNDVTKEVYLDTRHNLSEENEKRILGNVIELTVTDINDYIEETQEETESCCMHEVVCSLNDEINRLYDKLEEMSKKIEELEKDSKTSKETRSDIVSNSENKKETYYINDKEVTKKEYEEYYDELFRQIKRNRLMF